MGGSFGHYDGDHSLDIDHLNAAALDERGRVRISRTPEFSCNLNRHIRFAGRVFEHAHHHAGLIHDSSFTKAGFFLGNKEVEHAFEKNPGENNTEARQAAKQNENRDDYEDRPAEDHEQRFNHDWFPPKSSPYETICFRNVEDVADRTLDIEVGAATWDALHRRVEPQDLPLRWKSHQKEILQRQRVFCCHLLELLPVDRHRDVIRHGTLHLNLHVGVR